MNAHDDRTDAEDRQPRPDGSTTGGRPTFSLSGLRDGFLACVPLALGVAGYGLVFGVLATRAGLTVPEAALMSATVLAGAAQLLAIELWADPIPVVAVVVTTVVVNLRYLLMGAALRPYLRWLSPMERYTSAFFMADENWALTMGHVSEGGRQGAFLLGSGLAIWVFWVVATVVGATAGGLVGDPSRYGLDFVLPAVFLAIAVDLFDGRSDILPWGVALLVAVGVAGVTPGQWHVLCGGLAGSLVPVVRG